MVMFSRSALLALPKSNSLELQSLTRHPGSTASTTTCAAAQPNIGLQVLCLGLGVFGFWYTPCHMDAFSGAPAPRPCSLRHVPRGHARTACASIPYALHYPAVKHVWLWLACQQSPAGIPCSTASIWERCHASMGSSV